MGNKRKEEIMKRLYEKCRCDHVKPEASCFNYEHLKGDLADVSIEFFKLVEKMTEMLPDNVETSQCFRKLLEAKDCAVRSMLTGR